MQREQLMHDFIAQHGWHDAKMIALKQDASKRRYFRLIRDNQSAMLMDAPPPHEHTQPFVNMTNHLIQIGMRAPSIFAHNKTNGFILLEDLGDDTFTRLLANGENELDLYQHALNSLLHLHRQPEATKIDIGHYDFAALYKEVFLFIEWYLPYIRQVSVEEVTSDYQMVNQFKALWQTIYKSLPQLPQALVLRDFHIDNVMRNAKDCAVIDYQDALIGSPIYDVVSLIEDARRDVSADTYKTILSQYIEESGYDKDAILVHLHFWGAQRHTKVAGIFARLYLRDNKPMYLSHLPRVIGLLNSHLDIPALLPLKQWMQQYFPELSHPPVQQHKPLEA